jgi:hypothetical protein
LIGSGSGGRRNTLDHGDRAIILAAALAALQSSAG